ncbi:MAG: hypothetical protein F6J97_13105 [Leptolyngbya sp. SIO4C1]|nr:hypothetical protein [Leptolyngbya sp. SIO4C1]
MAESGRFYVKLGGAVGDIGEIKFGFVAPKVAYENIADELGVISIDDDSSARGILFGGNYPKPPVVRISTKKLSNGTVRSAKRYCDPDKVGRVLNGSLNNQKIKINSREYDIRQVSMAS